MGEFYRLCADTPASGLVLLELCSQGWPHPNGDFFIADIFDQTPFKNDLASMEHPFYSLSKKSYKEPFEYKNGDFEIIMTPHATLGMPTIYDKDLLLYCGSILVDELNEGRTPPKEFHISLNDFFIATNRDNGGKSYDKIKDTLDRLAGCYVKTNIKTNGKRQVKGFSLIKYEYIESLKVKNRHINVKIEFCDWLYNGILGKEVVSINRDYFRLAKGLERRLYEIARKHCGNQKRWSIGIEKLYHKSGSRSPLPTFKNTLKVVIKDGHIPDYQYALDSSEKMVTVSRTKAIEANNPPISEHTTRDMVFNFKRRIKRQTLVNAEKIHNDSYTDWSMDEIIIQFITFAESKSDISNVDAAFVGFVKKKVKTFKKDSHCY